MKIHLKPRLGLPEVECALERAPQAREQAHYAEAARMLQGVAAHGVNLNGITIQPMRRLLRIERGIVDDVGINLHRFGEILVRAGDVPEPRVVAARGFQIAAGEIEEIRYLLGRSCLRPAPQRRHRQIAHAVGG